MALVACGSDSTETRTTDAAVDSSRDAQPKDGAPADVVLPSDTPRPVDTSKGDGAMPDVLPVDARLVDAPMKDAPLGDAPAVDAPQTDGAAQSDADGDTSSADAIETTQAIITFRFKNTGTQTVYLYQGCTTSILVTGLGDGKTYNNEGVCACDCASSSCNGAIACGPCMAPMGVSLEPGKTQDIPWYARSMSMGTKTGVSGQFQCVHIAPVPVGSYKVGIGVYTAESDAAAKANGHTVEKSFTLGTGNAIIEVPVQ